jgi:RHS repeat-associated protein
MLFTDYLGDLPYNDGVLDQSTYAHSDATRYLGLAAEKDVSSGAETYYHGDLIDSTVAATDAEGELASWGEDDARLAYTAFGEVLTAGEPNDGGGAPGGSAPEGAPRYQYAGGYGYESGLLTLQGADTTLPPITLQHLGYRWYQPDSGRFVQRDPIGLIGGPNIYAYTNNAPVRATDPQGLTTIHPRDWWEQMRRHNRAIARWLRELRKTTPLTRAEALGRLRAALAARNATYLGRFGPWMIAAICVQYGIVEPVVAAGDEWNEKTKGVEGLVNRRRIGRMGGFSPAESDDLWGY